MSEAPSFWFASRGVLACILSPFGYLYSRVANRRMTGKPQYVSKVPVLCIGNYVAGGAGKTPTAIAIAKIAREMGLRPGFLSRGHGGQLKGPQIVDLKNHTADAVGDEPLVLATYATTVVSVDRPAGAKLLEEHDVDLIIMDDGLQNPKLHKDHTIAVVDGRRGLGNGFAIPAGPLRGSITAQMGMTDSVLVIGEGDPGISAIRTAAKMAKPVLSAWIVEQRSNVFDGASVYAYCGIADPQKFIISLEKVGCEVVGHRFFPDHHPFQDQQCQEMITEANRLNAKLVTTQKDAARLRAMGGVQEGLLSLSAVLHIDIEFENPRLIESIVASMVETKVSP